MTYDPKEKILNCDGDQALKHCHQEFTLNLPKYHLNLKFLCSRAYDWTHFKIGRKTYSLCPRCTIDCKSLALTPTQYIEHLSRQINNNNLEG